MMDYSFSDLLLDGRLLSIPNLRHSAEPQYRAANALNQIHNNTKPQPDSPNESLQINYT